MTKKIDEKIIPKIIVPHGCIRKMSNDFGVCADTISDALAGKFNSRVSKIIRNAAINIYNGAETTINK